MPPDAQAVQVGGEQGGARQTGADKLPYGQPGGVELLGSEQTTAVERSTAEQQGVEKFC